MATRTADAEQIANEVAERHVLQLLRTATRSPRQHLAPVPAEIYAEIQRSAGVGSFETIPLQRAVANITIPDVVGGNTPTDAPIPWPVAAPLLDRLATDHGNVAFLGGVAMSPNWPSEIVAAEQSGEKEQLPSVAPTVSDANTLDVHLGVVVDVSLYLDQFLQLAGRGGLLVAWLRGQTRAAADKRVAAELVTRATTAATLDAALDTFDGLWSPKVVAGRATGLLGSAPQDLAAIGIELVNDQHLASVLVIDPAGVDCHTQFQLLARTEPAKVGTMVAGVCRLVLGVSDGAVVKVGT
jgi:hypothetical protein